MARSTSVTLNDQLQKFVDEQVASGRFESASDVVSEGLRRFEADERQLVWLRKEIEHGRDQVLNGQFHEDSDEFWKKLNRQVDERLRRGEEIRPHVRP